MRHDRFNVKKRSRLTRAIAFFVAFILIATATLTAALPAPNTNPSLQQALSHLPSPRTHPLPTSLVEAANQTGDYFDQIQPSVVGALVWSTFPITVYIQPITPTEQATPFLAKRSQDWISAVQKAVQEWNRILPLAIASQPQTADIAIQRSALPLRLEPSKHEAGDRRLAIPRARSAETRYELYAKRSATADLPPTLSHRMTIYIRPDQAIAYLQAAARHELGHALGIWGHSPLPTDALYFSQVRNPAQISARDINTLKRVYEQPTRLGWAMPEL